LAHIALAKQQTNGSMQLRSQWVKNKPQVVSISSTSTCVAKDRYEQIKMHGFEKTKNSSKIMWW